MKIKLFEEFHSLSEGLFTKRVKFHKGRHVVNGEESRVASFSGPYYTDSVTLTNLDGTKYTETPFGTFTHYNSEGKFHRLDGPAKSDETLPLNKRKIRHGAYYINHRIVLNEKDYWKHPLVVEYCERVHGSVKVRQNMFKDGAVKGVYKAPPRD